MSRSKAMTGIQLVYALWDEGPNGVRAANTLMSEWGGSFYRDGIDMQKLRKATDKDLRKIPGIGPHALSAIRKFVQAPTTRRRNDHAA